MNNFPVTQLSSSVHILASHASPTYPMWQWQRPRRQSPLAVQSEAPHSLRPSSCSPRPHITCSVIQQYGNCHHDKKRRHPNPVQDSVTNHVQAVSCLVFHVHDYHTHVVWAGDPSSQSHIHPRLAVARAHISERSV